MEAGFQGRAVETAELFFHTLVKEHGHHVQNYPGTAVRWREWSPNISLKKKEVSPETLAVKEKDVLTKIVERFSNLVW